MLSFDVPSEQIDEFDEEQLNEEETDKFVMDEEDQRDDCAGDRKS